MAAPSVRTRALISLAGNLWGPSAVSVAHKHRWCILHQQQHRSRQQPCSVSSHLHRAPGVAPPLRVGTVAVSAESRWGRGGGSWSCSFLASLQAPLRQASGRAPRLETQKSHADGWTPPCRPRLRQSTSRPAASRRLPAPSSSHGGFGIRHGGTSSSWGADQTGAAGCAGAGRAGTCTRLRRAGWRAAPAVGAGQGFGCHAAGAVGALVLAACRVLAAHARFFAAGQHCSSRQHALARWHCSRSAPTSRPPLHPSPVVQPEGHA